jgi:hypothetical protein
MPKKTNDNSGRRPEPITILHYIRGVKIAVNKEGH